MEEANVRVSSLRSTTSNGKSSPRGSPSFRRLNSGRTPRREGKGGGSSAQWVRNNRIVLWLLLITLWAYAGFYIQSRWAHGDNKEGIFGGNEDDQMEDDVVELKQKDRRDLMEADDYLTDLVKPPTNETKVRILDEVPTKNGTAGANSTNQSAPLKKKGRKLSRSARRKAHGKQKAVKVEDTDIEVQEEQLPATNATYGMLVGPFGSLEDTILGWGPEKRSGTCDRKGQFARLVWSRKFVLIFHELSMTGAPLAMMELATELLSCGATVNVVLLSKRGGLMHELARRKIRVLEDKLDVSFKTAMKADLIIAGSAVSASWIEKYRDHTVLGSSQIAWWIMENRREYFDRAKLVLSYVKRLVFLSESQSKQWLAWCEEEKIHLKSAPELIPLSVNDELAFVAGIPCSLNTPNTSTETMLERKQLLRTAVRKEMGLTDDDMLVVSLSSINPGKGQFLLLESARIIVENELPPINPVVESTESRSQNNKTRVMLQKGHPKKNRKQKKGARKKQQTSRRLLEVIDRKKNQKLKVLIGSVSSKSNKVDYVKALLQLVSEHKNLSSSVLWTPATTRIASLYAAADVYVMNAQGLGETFGRVTIEAMAFGLPVLGTDAGGTKELVEHNITGLLHPLTRPGALVLAKDIQYLLENPSARQRMGAEGRKKVENMYMKKHMYKKFGEVLYNCMRLK